MNDTRYIAGDWGTSNLRLYLCAYGGHDPSMILESRTGPGVSQLDGDIEAGFFDLVDDWISTHGPMPVILSGMVGSTMGWKDVPYLQCPVDAAQIVEGQTDFEARGLNISIVAGLKADNPLGSPDVMRGEELQLLGWMTAFENLADETRLFALPGTHNKWVLLRNGRIETFLTALTGELFALLEKHSVLVRSGETNDFNPDAFKAGLAAVEHAGGAHLLHTLFTTRSRQVLGTMPATDASSYLSGLLVGSDVIGATALFGKMHPEIDTVTIIGDSRLSDYYRLALEHRDMQVTVCDTAGITIAAYDTIYTRLYC